VVSAFGASRILWGSNFPAAEGSLSDLLAEARQGLAALPEPDRNLILGGSAKQLYPGLTGVAHD
jgi:L-fuconolactonase